MEPVGFEDSVLKRTEFDAGGPYPEVVTAVLKAGMFGSSEGNLDYAKFRLIKRGFDVLVGEVRRQRGVW